MQHSRGGGGAEYIEGFSAKANRKDTYCEGLDIDRRIILRRISGRQVHVVWFRFT
jgi:hypothetical protein